MAKTVNYSNENENLEMRLLQLATEVGNALESSNRKCVFAESCTGGKMAAALTTVPGISNSFCGSAVTYREATKQQWIDVAPESIVEHTAESDYVTREMARGVLKKTTEANLAVAITGHLGPGAPAAIDGIVFVAVIKDDQMNSQQFRLTAGDRRSRQTEAACRALEFFLESSF